MKDPIFTTDKYDNFVIICNYEQLDMFKRYYQKQKANKYKLEQKLIKLNKVFGD